MKTYEGFFDADRNRGLRVTGPDGLKELREPGEAMWGADAYATAYSILLDAYEGDGPERAEHMADECYVYVGDRLLAKFSPDEPMYLSWYEVTGLANSLIMQEQSNG